MWGFIIAPLMLAFYLITANVVLGTKTENYVNKEKQEKIITTDIGIKE